MNMYTDEPRLETLVPRNGSTPERVVVKKAVGVGLSLMINKCLKFVVVQHNDSRYAVCVTQWA